MVLSIRPIMEDTKEIEDTSDLKGHLGNLTKAPTPNVPRVSGRPFNKDKIHCYECKEFGHMQKDCPELNKPHKEDNPSPKKFEDDTYTYSGPDIQSQMQMNSVNPNMATTYDQT